MSENVCTACGGSGQQWSGVEYMGQHEIVGCDECWGTGFDDVLAGVDSLRALLAQRDAELEALRAAANRVVRVWTWADPETWDSEEWNNAHDDLVAALSDNQESLALTDKEGR